MSFGENCIRKKETYPLYSPFIVTGRTKRRKHAINLHLYHYAGNNPVRYTDPDGRFVMINMNYPKETKEFCKNEVGKSNYLNGKWIMPGFFNSSNHDSIGCPMIKKFLQNNLDNKIELAQSFKDDKNPNTNAKVTAKTVDIGDGLFEISVKVELYSGDKIVSSSSASITYAGSSEVMSNGKIDNKKVNDIANRTISYSQEGNSYGKKNYIDD